MSNHKSPFAILFDMDGVILDSERLIAECWREIGEEAGLPDAYQVAMECTGTTAAATRQIFEARFGQVMSFAQFDEACMQRFRQKQLGGMIPLRPGVRECLDWIVGHGIPCAIASSTDTALAREELAAAGVLQAFNAVIGGDKVTKSKPEPDIFLAAAETLGYAPEDCWVVEDSYHGIRAASAAGCRPVMVPDLLAPNEEMRALCIRILPSLTDFRDFLAETAFADK